MRHGYEMLVAKGKGNLLEGFGKQLAH